MGPQSWDVFICHRGPDAKKEFASSLHFSFHVQGISAFLNHEMPGGDDAPVSMEMAMQTAKWGIVILFLRFFESGYCMRKLSVIVK
jgi:hypothetical protein